MADSPTLVLAFAAGLVSFVSPCVLPLVPGYLAAVGGRPPGSDSGSSASSGQAVRGRTLARSALFVATFSTIFILLGLSATAIGDFLFDSRPVLNRVAGAVIVLMGLLFVGALFVTRLNRDWRPSALAERAGRGGPVLAGAAFAVAWTPCVGPTLGAILGLAATTQGTGRGAGLLAVYSAGLALPFLGCALAWDTAQRSLGFVRRHHAAIQGGAGVVLVAIGILVFTGELFRLNVEIQQALDRLGLNFFESV